MSHWNRAPTPSEHCSVVMPLPRNNQYPSLGCPSFCSPQELPKQDKCQQSVLKTAKSLQWRNSICFRTELFSPISKRFRFTAEKALWNSNFPG